MPTSYSYTINTICAYLNCKHAKCMLHLNFLLFSFVCLFVCFVGEVSEGIIGRAGQSGSEEPAADRELRCRQSAGAHFSWELGRGGITATRGLLIAPRQYVCGRDTPVPPPTPAPARPQPILLLLPGKGTGVPAAGSASPHLGCPPPPPSSSRPLPPPPCALPHPAPTGGSGADPAAFARPAGSPAVSPDPILSTSKVSRTSIVACFAACRGFIFEKGGIYFSAGAPEWVKWSRVNPSLKGLQTATVSH